MKYIEIMNTLKYCIFNKMYIDISCGFVIVRCIHSAIKNVYQNTFSLDVC